MILLKRTLLMSAELFTMTDHLSITDQLLLLYVYDLHLKIIDQHLQAAQEVLHWKFSPQEIKADDVKNQSTVPALHKENCSLNPEESLQKEPAEEEVLKISVEEAAAVALVQETVQVSHPEQTSVAAINTSAMEKKSRRKMKTCECFSWLWSCRR
ncbi:hypothetical protein G5714_003015 [Onychostoma macrolepis]|uniref:Uncharacterized protein n=1 Tax=Onychostoma macrolepis TaxID=369639 RepID=A0A7J6D897_9TELE|nr:hypothetical protein G5714_003015 [Onychostoma macrolepis]